MNKILIAGCSLFLISIASAQQKEGKVIYERTTIVQMNFNFAGMSNEMAQQMVPKSRTDKFELNFANNQSLWKQAEQENNDDNDFGGGGMQIRMIVAGSNDVMFCNFDDAKKVEQREVFDKKFIIEDSIRSLKWKLSDETKSILNHVCRKGIATRYGKRTMMNVDNGKMERKEVDDTTNIIAWFTTDIPVSAGPAEYQGQLPGLILEMDINNGRQTFKATDISAKADVASIKEPTGKKRYTTEEFNKEREKMMQEMQRNNQGGRQVIRMN
jgi:GLPGLI family protein